MTNALLIWLAMTTLSALVLVACALREARQEIDDLEQRVASLYADLAAQEAYSAALQRATADTIACQRRAGKPLAWAVRGRIWEN